MASVGHIAVGMAAARIDPRGRMPRASSMAWWSVLSLLPDADVIGFAFGIEYVDPWGHRGATHSLVFALAVGIAIGLAARWLNRPALRTGLMATAVLVSHAMLDTMTDGGLGCALLWPFDLTRYFAPWRPIPVAPLAFDFLSPDGALVSLVELVLFFPLILYALRSRRAVTKPVAVILAAWLVSVSVWSYSERTRDAISGFVLREDTAFASGFSETAFRQIASGLQEAEVRRLLGAPFRELWFYTLDDPGPPDERPAPREQACLIVVFEAGAAVITRDTDACRARGVTAGLAAVDIERRLGPPLQSCWQYSWSPGNTRFRERTVCFSNTRVQMVIRQWS